MGLKKRRVIFSNKAKETLRSYITYLRKEVSLEMAEHVRKGILAKCQKLENFSGYSMERYLEDESVEYRSVTQWDYNIIYTVTPKEIRILNIIHTSQHPDLRKNI